MTETYSPLRPTRRLHGQPSLEQLRKQAKDLLAQYRDGDSNAVSEVRQFERAPERLTFTLNDAQRVLARAYGYASWAKLKAFVDGIHVARLIEVVQAGDIAQARVVLNARPELVHMDVNGGNEHRALHYAVLRRDAAMVKLLMEAGADARKGIYPHRDATSALTLAEERGYSEIAAIIKAEEQQRRLEMSCPNATVSPAQDQIHAAISHGDRETAIRLLNADKSLIQACDRHGSTPLHIAAEENDKLLVDWLLERRADVRKQDANGFTPLDRAALSADPRNGNAKSFPEVAGRLLAHGAEMTIYSAVALADTTRVAELLKADRAPFTGYAAMEGCSRWP